MCWSSDNDHLLFATGSQLVIKAVQGERKQLEWKAHDGAVLCADWNPVNNLIVSGGEDCKYKVWDAFGRQLYQSFTGEHVITSVAWTPSGEHFAVGSFNRLELCDKTGVSWCTQRGVRGRSGDRVAQGGACVH